MEDEEGIVYSNTQVREADGWSCTKSQVDVNLGEDYYIRDHRIDSPVPLRHGIGSVWTPNTLNVFVPDQPYPRMRRWTF